MYEMYLKFMDNMTYQKYIILMAMLGIILICAIHQIIINHKAKMPKEIGKRFLKVCELENRQPIDQEHYIIKKYVEEYERENQVDLSQ